MSIGRASKDRDLTHRFVCIDKTIMQNPLLSLEGKGYYGMLEAEMIALKDVPQHIIKELIAVGFVMEVNS